MTMIFELPYWIMQVDLAVSIVMILLFLLFSTTAFTTYGLQKDYLHIIKAFMVKVNGYIFAPNYYIKDNCYTEVDV